ncbi:ATP-binding protein [Micromonospora musae]|uniref:ATP-binding protein n=1 Tax=Micromonospora musae TaxID=1894970 RepID=UPI0033EC52CE
MTVVRDPDDATATRRLLKAIEQLDAGVLVVRPQPFTQNPGQIALALLSALGKHNIAKLASNQGIRRLAAAWVIGHRPGHIVVDRAHTLGQSVLEDLIATSRASQARLWLVDASSTGALQTRFAPSLVNIATVDTLADLPQPPAPPLQADPRLPEDLPEADFLTFLAVCSRRLPPDDFAAVRTVYRKALSSFLSFGFPRNRNLLPLYEVPDFVETLTLKLASVFYSGESEAVRIVQLRATQAALLRSGLLLHHKRSLALLGHPAHLGCRLTPTAADALRTQTDTTRAAAVLVNVLMPPYNWSRVNWTIASVSDDASALRTDVGPIPVPAHGQPILRAHIAWRRMTGANDSDPLIVHKGIKTEAEIAALQRRLPLHTGHSPYLNSRTAFSGQSTTWMRQRLLTLEHVTAFTPSPWSDVSLLAQS